MHVWGMTGEKVEEVSESEQVGLSRSHICLAGNSRRTNRLREAKNGFILDMLGWKEGPQTSQQNCLCGIGIHHHRRSELKPSEGDLALRVWSLALPKVSLT